MKKLHKLLGCLVLCYCLLGLAATGYTQSKEYHKRKLMICERLFEEGRYLKALRYSNQLLEVLQKSENAADSLTVPIVLMQQAKYYEALSQFDTFQKLVEQSLQLRQGSSLPFAKGLLEASDLYLQFSDVIGAERYLNQAQSILEKEALQDTWFQAQAAHLATRIAYQKGDYRQALSLIPDLLEILASRITDSETYFDEGRNQYTSRTLTKAGLKDRKAAYAKGLMLQAVIERDRGNYSVADSLFLGNDLWIKENIHRTGIDHTYIKNTHEHIKLQLMLAKDPQEIRRAMEKNLFRAERAVGLVHKLYIEAHELLIQSYTEMRYGTKGKKQLWELKTNTERYYSEASLPFAIYEKLQAKRSFYSRSNSLLGGLRAVFIDREDILIEAQKEFVSIKNDIQKIPLNHAERIDVLNQLYKVSLSLNELDSAFSYLDQLLTQKAAVYGKNSLTYHLSRIDLADYYVKYSTKTEEVRKILDESFHQYIEKELLPNSLKHINALDEYAFYYSSIGKFDSASYMIDQAVGLMEENVGTRHPLYAQMLEQQVRLDLEQGEFQEVNASIDSMLMVYQESYDRHSAYSFKYAQALSTAANYYATIGLFSNAHRALNRSDRYSRRSDASNFDPNIQQNRLELLIETEQLKEAEELAIEAIENKTQAFGSRSRFLIDPYLFRASIFLIDGDYIGAREMVEKAYELSKENYGDRSFKSTKALSIRAQVFTALGSYDKAIADLNQIIDIKSDIFGPEHVQLAKPYMQLGLATFFGDESQTETAAVLLDKSVKLYSSALGEDNPAYAEALKTQAQVYTAIGNLQEAQILLETARNIWTEKLGNEFNSNTAEIDLLLGDILVKQEKYELAQEQYESTQNIYRKIFTKQHPGYIQALGRLGRVHYMQKDYKKALKYTEQALTEHYRIIEDFFPAMSEGEKARFWQTIRVDFEFFNTLAVAASQQKNKKLVGEIYNNIINTKAILLSNSIKVRNDILNSGNSTLIASYEKWEALKEQLIEELSFSPEQLKEDGLDPKRTQKEIDELEKQLSQLSSEFSKSQDETVVSWKEIKAQLQPNEVAVEIVRFRHFENSFTDSVVYAALVLSPKEPRPIFIPIEQGNNLETKYMRYYRACVEYKVEDNKSYDHYWRAIDQVLEKGNKIYLSGDGAYNQINLEAVLADNGQYVLDNSDIALVTNTKEIYTQRNGKTSKGEILKDVEPMPANNNIVLFGNPAFYKDLAEEELMSYNDRDIIQLKGTQEEVLQLDSLLRKSTNLKPKVNLNWKATETVMKSVENPDILHIATHGYFFPDTKQSNDSELARARGNTSALLRSGILLAHAGDLMASGNIYEFNKAPGILTAYEATSLRLDNTDLVVLSACETARGDVKVGEGVYGLQRSFLLAGADAIIMSLFKVNDQATQQFMIYFYTNWKVKGMEKRKAFSEAKKQLREEFPEPIYWSPFIMVGSI